MPAYIKNVNTVLFVKKNIIKLTVQKIFNNLLKTIFIKKNLEFNVL